MDINPYAAPESPVDLALGRPTAVPGFRSVTPVAQAITVVLGLIVLFTILGDVNQLLTISALRRTLAGAAVAHAELATGRRRFAIGILALSVLYIAAWVLFCLFMPRANRNARAFGVPMTFTPRWAAGVFFVPFWNFYKPYRAMTEIWQASDPDPQAPALLRPASSILSWWWGLYLLSGVADQIHTRAFKHAKGDSELISQSWSAILVSVVSIASAVLAATVVRAVARRQDQRQRTLPAGMPHPPG